MVFVSCQRTLKIHQQEIWVCIRLTKVRIKLQRIEVWLVLDGHRWNFVPVALRKCDIMMIYRLIDIADDSTISAWSQFNEMWIFNESQQKALKLLQRIFRLQEVCILLEQGRKLLQKSKRLLFVAVLDSLNTKIKRWFNFLLSLLKGEREKSSVNVNRLQKYFLLRVERFE